MVYHLMNLQICKRVRSRLFIVPVFSAIFILMGSWAWAIDLGNSLIRDYPISLTLPQKWVEVGLDAMRIDNNLVLNDAPRGTTGLSGLEDMNRFRGLLNYGLFDRTTIHASLSYTDIDFRREGMTVKAADISVKQNLYNEIYGLMPFLAIDFGMRNNYGDDLPGYRDLQDQTFYGRMTAGKILGNIYPNLFLEYGHSSIDIHGDNAQIPTGLMDKNYDQLKGGISMLIKFPYKAIAALEYNYLRILEGDIDGVESNHIARAEFNYFFTPQFILNVGATYYHRGLNGTIPFLTPLSRQEDNEEHYIGVHIGGTFLFQGD